jgi:hypothetical protein
VAAYVDEKYGDVEWYLENCVVSEKSREAVKSVLFEKE